MSIKYTTSNGTNITNICDSYLETDISYILKTLGINLYPQGNNNCTKCKKDTQIVLSYGDNFTRKLCKSCVNTNILDKLFGLNIDPTTEAVLFGPKCLDK